MQADAVEVVRISSLKTFRALQTFVRFFTQICTDIARHRCLAYLCPFGIVHCREQTRAGLLLDNKISGIDGVIEQSFWLTAG